jgi:hypothetical protein
MLVNPSIKEIAMLFNVNEFVAPACAVVMLSVPPEALPGMTLAMNRLAAAAEEVMDFPLESDIEIAPVFMP